MTLHLLKMKSSVFKDITIIGYANGNLILNRRFRVFLRITFLHVSSQAAGPDKSCQMSKKLDKNNCTRNMKDFDNFTKIALKCG